MLTSGFKESSLSNIVDDIPEFANKRLSAVEYGYESDSDLEDEERDWPISDSGAVEDREVRRVLEEKERQATPRAEVATKSNIEDTTMAVSVINVD